MVRGDHTSAWRAQAEVFAWLIGHRDQVSRCASRIAWVFEDEPMRRNTDRWLALLGGRLFRGETTTFSNVRAAIAWLATADAGQGR